MAKTNSCPMDVFIRKLAKELDVTLETARHIYDTMTVVTVELLDEYDSVKPINFVDVERELTKEKTRYNPHTGEIDVVQPKDKIKASISRHYKEYDKVHEFVDRHEDKLERQKIREVQLEEERKELEELKRKQRRNQRRRTHYRKMKERQRRRATERLIEEEMMIEQEEKRQYEKDLRKRLKG